MTPVHLVRDRYWRSRAEARIADPVVRLDVDLGRATIVETDSDSERKKSSLPMF